MMPNRALGFLLVALMIHACRLGSQTIAGNRDNQPVTREKIVDILGHQESLLRSCECLFQTRQLATSPEMVGLIQSNVNEEIRKGAIWTEERASQPAFRYQVRLWRKGAKSRSEIYRLDDNVDDGRYRGVEAFDGLLLRKLATSTSSGVPQGSVETLRYSAWHGRYKYDPYSLICEHFAKPWSEIIAGATGFKAVKDYSHADPIIKVSLDLKKGYNAVVLKFNPAYQLIERRYFGTPLTGGKTDVVSTENYSDYRSYLDPSGEVIWFPHKVVCQFFLGRTAGGVLLNQSTIQTDVLHVAFNTDIDDAKFVLHFPREAVVFDGVTSLGFLDPGVRPPLVFPEEARKRYWYYSWLGPSLGALILAILGAYLYRRRSKQQLG
jgi:hypothetical protein